eukprot:s815_g6.t1
MRAATGRPPKAIAIPYQGCCADPDDIWQAVWSEVELDSAMATAKNIRLRSASLMVAPPLDAALELYRAVLQREPRHRDALLGYADCQQDLGNIDEALTAMKQLLSAKSDDLEANLRVAELLLEQNKESEVEPYLRYGRLGRRSASALLQQRLLCAEAQLALNKEEYSKALSTASEAVRVDPSTGRALLLLATARHRVADYSAALRAVAAALEPAGDEGISSRRFQAACHALAAQAHERLREYPEAIARAERALQLQPKLLTARLAKALAKQQSGHILEAEEELMSILQSNPQHGQARLQLAYCKMCSSNAPRAAAILEGLLASKAPLPRSQLGCAKAYLALALAQQRRERAVNLAKEAVLVHRNLQTVWQGIQSSRLGGREAVQRLRGICDLDLNVNQANELLQLLSAENQPVRRTGRETPVQSMPGTPTARGFGTPTGRSRETSQERGFTIAASAQVACPLGTQVSAGGDHALILMPGSSGSGRSEAYALGDNSYGQLGAGHNQVMSTRVKIQLGQSPIEAVAAGSTHSLLISEGKVYGMGDNCHGQLGLGSTESYFSPMQMSLPEDLKAVAASAGCWFSLILMQSGEVYGVGYNYNGQLSGDTWRLLTPQKLDLPGKARAVAAGCSHSLVLMDSGDVYGLGENWYGQLGIGSKERWAQTPGCSQTFDNPPIFVPLQEDQHQPKKMLLNGTAKAVASGTQHSVVLMDSGEVYSTGDNVHGQLGLGDNQAALQPRRVSFNAAETTAVAVAAGDQHTLVALADGRCFGAGDNGNGQLGVPGFQERRTGDVG